MSQMGMSPDELDRFFEWYATQQGQQGGGIDALVSSLGASAYGGEEPDPAFKVSNAISDRFKDVTSLAEYGRASGMIPGLPAEVFAPDPRDAPEFDPMLDLFRQNPAYQMIDGLMQGVDGAPPMSFDEAFQAVSADREQGRFLPMGVNNGVSTGEVDTVRAREEAMSLYAGNVGEQRSADAFDAQTAAYDRFVNGASEVDERFGGESAFRDTVAGMMRGPAPEAGPSMADSLGIGFGLGRREAPAATPGPTRMTRQIAEPMAPGSTGASGTGMVTAEDMRLYEQKFGKPQGSNTRTESYNVARSARRGGANQDRRDRAEPVGAKPGSKEYGDAEYDSRLRQQMERYLKGRGAKLQESGQSQRNRMSNEWANSQLYRG